MLTLASYNIQKAVGRDLRRNPERVLRVIKETGADVVVLQEADRRFGEREAALPRADIARMTELEPAHVAVRPLSIGWHGNAVLVRRTLRVLRAGRLVLPHFEPRGAVEVVVELDGGPLIVVGAHLALTTRWRRRQAEVLADYAGRAHMPLILCGDLNEWPEAGKGLEPLAAALTEHVPGRTWPAWRPVATLDRLYHCGALRVERTHVHDTPLSRQASDHLPIVAELRRAA